MFLSIYYIVLSWLKINLPRILGSLVILFGGWWLSRRVAKQMESSLKRAQLNPTLRPLLLQITKLGLLLLIIITVLATLGVQTGAMITFLGTAGLAIGLALQGTLSNVAAGIVILLQRPFKVGDTLNVSGNIGRVLAIGLVATEFQTPDGLYMIAPNSYVWTNVVRNLSRNEKRRIELQLTISYNDNVGEALRVLKSVVLANPRVLRDPEPIIAVGELADRGVKLIARPWVATKNYATVSYELRRSIKEAFDAHGISLEIPLRHAQAFDREVG